MVGDPQVPVLLSVKRIQEFSFTLNEAAYNPHYPHSKVHFNHRIGSNLKEDLLEFVLIVHYIQEETDKTLFSIEVQNVFEVKNIGRYTDGHQSSFPPDLLLSVVSLSISHTRSLLARQIAGTVFAGTILPIVPPREVAEAFFGKEIIEKR